jgi:hypothetical protein
MGLDAHVNRKGVHEDHAELSDRAVSKRIGNMWHVSVLREEVQGLRNHGCPFTILLQRVLYSGIHGGDEIPLQDVFELQSELDDLESRRLSPEADQFLKDMRELCAVSIVTGNPIVF